MIAALQQELREKNAIVDLFDAVALAASESSGADDAMQICVEKMCAYTGWAVGHVYVTTGDGEALVSANAWHGDDETLLLAFKRATMDTTFRAGIGLPGRALSTGAPVWLSDLATDPNFPRAALAENIGLVSGVAFPALARGQVVAVLEFFSRSRLDPDIALIRAMSYIGLQVGRVVERKKADEALGSSEALKAAMLESALDSIITADHEGRIIDFNPAAERTFGYACSDVIGRELAAVIIPPQLREAHRRGMARYLATGEGAVLDRRIEVMGMRADGSEFPVELAIHAIHLGGKPMFTAYLRDITTRKELEQHLEHQAFHDSLTDLPNRTLFLDRVEHALARSDREQERHSVIYLDLDNFKEVNDSMGHAAGDELLAKVADRIRRRLRPGDTVARLGGDEFAVLLEDTDAETARRVALRVTVGLEAPLELGDTEVSIDASLGVATGTAGVARADELLRRADEAMYAAKERGGQRAVVLRDGDAPATSVPARRVPEPR